MFKRSRLVRCVCLVGVTAALALAAARPAWGEQTPTTQPDIPRPQIPDRVFKITDNGAVADGTTLCTEAIQKTIDACAQAGGGTVLVPAGKFLTGPIKLTSNLNFKVDEGATLLITDDPKNFKLVKPNYYENCISADNCHDLMISGTGTIDGQGKAWWESYLPHKGQRPGVSGAPPHRPHLIVIKKCTRLLVQDILLTRSPMFHLIPEACQDVVIQDVRIQAPGTGSAPNTDGIDPSGINYFITRCKISTGDDNIALKPVEIAVEGHPACENFLITDCTFGRGHGMSIGGQTPGGAKHIVVRNCTFQNTDNGIRLKAGRGEGGVCEDLTYENLTMKEVKYPITFSSYYANGSSKLPTDLASIAPKPMSATTPVWKNIRITNLTAEDSPQNAGIMVGLPEAHISDVVLTNVKIEGKNTFRIAFADGIKFVNCEITAKNGPPLEVVNSQVEGIDPSTGK